MENNFIKFDLLIEIIESKLVPLC